MTIRRDSKGKDGKKGYELEEVLRAYFLRAGFFVLRGLLFELEGEDMTDVDLWLYERSTTTTRRRQIVDIKSKARPKAKDRIIWASGISFVLEIDKAYIATTDYSPALRKIAHEFGVGIFDGADLKRIQESGKVIIPDRISEEDLEALVKAVDKSRKNKEYTEVLRDLKSSIVSVFGANSAVRALDATQFFAKKATEAHPNSDAAKTAGRLAYFSAALAAISLDYIGTDYSFKTKDERRELLTNSIRYGHSEKEDGMSQLNLATELVRQYVPNGAAVASALQQAVDKDLQKVPAEIISDYILQMDKPDGLFSAARDLDAAAYSRNCPNFDLLSSAAKSFMGVVLDFCNIERKAFALSWTADLGLSDQPSKARAEMATAELTDDVGPLFGNSGSRSGKNV